jgi:5-methylthioadenosine/S-adenosylhomocysteine deaminase
MIRIYNAKILTLEENADPFDGELWVDGTKIRYVGGENKEEAGKYSWERQIDAKGNLILPGFKNAHAHSAMTFLRSNADDLPLLQWLNESVFPYENKLTEDDIYHLTKLAIMEYLTSGITSAFDMYLMPDVTAQAAIDCGFRMVLNGGLNNYVQSLEEIEHWYQKWNRENPLIRFELGFHAEYTNSRENLEGMAALAKKYHAPVYAHNSEGLPEVIECKERTGLTPTAYMDSFGMFEYGGGLYHCVHMTEEDLDILKERNVGVITNPASNLKLASGIAPIRSMMEKDILLAIGTDGPASNNCLDMFREMFLVTALAKYREADAAAVDASLVLPMATIGGAKVMNLPECDCLKEGKQADLMMIDLHQPNMQPVNHLVKNIVYSGSKQNIKMTMIAGRILYEKGEFFIGSDPEEVYEKAGRIAKRIFS